MTEFDSPYLREQFGIYERTLLGAADSLPPDAKGKLLEVLTLGVPIDVFPEQAGWAAVVITGPDTGCTLDVDLISRALEVEAASQERIEIWKEEKVGAYRLALRILAERRQAQMGQ